MSASRVLGLTALLALAQPAVPGQDDLRTAVAAARARLSINAAETRDVTRLYERSSGAPVWCDAAGVLTPNARAALTLLDQAGTEGLNPADYGAAALTILRARLDERPADRVPLVAQFDVQLSAGILRYFRHLHLGRVDPRSLGLQIDAPAETHDYRDLLWSALKTSRLAETAADLTPPLRQYTALKEMLARYRALAGAPMAALEFQGTVKPGQPLPDAAPLQRFLMAVGDLAADTAPGAGVYDDSLRAAVVRFQTRHGLDTDGVIGPATQAAFRVPFATRVRQIELALERLRWLPDLSRGRLVVVNIPMFYLWTFETVPSPNPPEL